MELPILKKAKNVWDLWNLRPFILFSLFIQIILALFAPLRKKTSNKWMIFVIWSAYAAADWTANFVLGLITNSMPATSSTQADQVKGEILAFWASFLLLHLGGPDTITAFALEDNELWPRYLLGLISQILASGYVFFLSLPNHKLWVPTMLVFVAGAIRCAERVCSMFLASLDNIRDSARRKPSASYVDRLSDIEGREPQRVNTEGQGYSWYEKRGELRSVEVIQYAFFLFQTFKGLIVEQKFSSRDRRQNIDFFQARSPLDAFSVVEAELNMFYEYLYTKTKVVNSWAGFVGRLFCFGSLLASLLIFISMEKKALRVIDIWVTYILLIGAVALDFISIIMLISSDWSNVALRERTDSTMATLLKHFLIVKKKRRFQEAEEDDIGKPTCTKIYLSRRILLRRWSESIQQFNLINYTAHQSHSRILNRARVVSCEPITGSLRTFIFDTLRTRSLARQQVSPNISEYLMYKINILLDGLHGQNYITTHEYDEGLLLWHIATELIYVSDEDNDHAHQDSRRFAKLLSDYMMYLLLMQPTLMFSVSGMAKIRFEDTCALIKSLPTTKNVTFPNSKDPKLKTTYSILENVNELFPGAGGADKDKYVLYGAGLLARTLIWSPNFEDGSHWLLISEVWMEFMLYAANQCKAYTHAQQLSKGGELLTLVWLLATHFGLYKQFEE